MKYNLAIIFLIISAFSWAQADSLYNKIDDKGEKNGVWIVYLDSLLNPIDSTGSFFYAYEIYDNGKRVFKHYKDHNSDADSILYNLDYPEKGNPILLDGTFKWFTADGRILEHEEYSAGWPVYWKSYQYYAKDPNKCGFNEVLDWSKKYKGIEGTYYYEELWDGEVKLEGWFRKGKRGWRVYKIKK